MTFPNPEGCQFCRHKPGDAGIIATAHDSNCADCGNQFSTGNIFTIYKGVFNTDKGAVHKFLVLDRVQCNHCGRGIDVFHVMCSGEHRDDLSFEKTTNYNKEDALAAPKESEGL